MLKAGTAARRRTLTWPAPQAPESAKAMIVALLHEIDTRLQRSKADWVGHVKILISGGDNTMYGSITTADDQPRWSGALTAALTKAEMTVYAAIYTLTDPQVAEAVDGALAADTPVQQSQVTKERPS